MKKILSYILTVALCLIMILPSCICFAEDINVDEYKDIYSSNGNDRLISAGGKILAVVQVIGVASAVILLLILGIKYMMMSSNAESKATIKEKLVPYAIGAVLLFGGTGLLSIIANFAQNITTKQ